MLGGIPPVVVGIPSMLGGIPPILEVNPYWGYTRVLGVFPSMGVYPLIGLGIPYMGVYLFLQWYNTANLTWGFGIIGVYLSRGYSEISGCQIQVTAGVFFLIANRYMLHIFCQILKICVVFFFNSKTIHFAKFLPTSGSKICGSSFF